MREASVSVAIVALIFSIAAVANADVQPCPNAHVATQQEADSASPKGSIIAGYTMVCPGDSVYGINNDAGAAKDYLKTILCPPDGDNYGGYGPEETIRRLDGKFAVCAAAMLKSLNSNGPPYCIREGARTVEKQNAYVARGVIACKYGAACEHPRGIAIDINTVDRSRVSVCDSYKRAHQSAASFGLTFYMGCRDAYHFVPQKSGCTAGGTAVPGGSFPTGGTNSNPNGLLPASFYDYPQYAPVGSPMSGLTPFTSALTSLAQQTNQAQTSQTASQTATGNPYANPVTYPTANTGDPTSGTSLNTSSNPYQYNVPTSSSTPGAETQAAADRVAASGANGNTSGTTGTNVSSGGNDSAGSASSAGGSAGASTGESTGTQLNDDLNDVAIDPNHNVHNNPDPTTNNISHIVMDHLAIADTVASTSVVIPPAYVQDTFGQREIVIQQTQATSGDDTAAKKSLLVSLLTALRDFLLSYLSFLKNRDSFGFNAPWQMPDATRQYH
jgi:hypothetical protein